MTTVELPKIKNFIGGEFLEPSTNNYLENYNPAKGQVYSYAPDSGEKDALMAIEAAKNAFSEWKKWDLNHRIEIIQKLAKKIKDNAEELAMMETIDTGKPLSLSKALDIPRSSFNFEFFCEEMRDYKSISFFHNKSQTFHDIRRSPVGVVTLITPWNLPLYLLTWKLAPALLTGNTVVAKPSEVTPMTAYKLCQYVQEVGFPPGVFNVVHGTGQNLGYPLCVDESVKAISFTGSTATGKKIASLGISKLKKVSLEMGGKNPTIVFADCDFRKTVKETIRSAFANQGQVCLCGERIFVEKSLYSQFKYELILETKKLNIGDPTQENTHQGSVVSKPHLEKIKKSLALAKEEGAQILCGGEEIKNIEGHEKGWFFAPTLMESLDYKCRTNNEEIFGPVAALIPFETEEELLEMANYPKYGLSASIWTKDKEKAKRIAEELHVGTVWINHWMVRDLRAPFGGDKESGLGKEGGKYSLDFFSKEKNICY